VGGAARYGDLSAADGGGELGEDDRASCLMVRWRMSAWFLSRWPVLRDEDS
jgi:hypothetical protein